MKRKKAKRARQKNQSMTRMLISLTILLIQLLSHLEIEAEEEVVEVSEEDTEVIKEVKMPSLEEAIEAEVIGEAMEIATVKIKENGGITIEDVVLTEETVEEATTKDMEMAPLGHRVIERNCIQIL